MWLTIIGFIAVGMVVATAVAVLFSSLARRHLRTVPKPPKLAPEILRHFSAEMRAGIQLHQACFLNDPKAAAEALTLWAWASGETAVANGLDRKMEALGQPDFRNSIEELWCHLENSEKEIWFGDPLWNAFVSTFPEFQDLELIG